MVVGVRDKHVARGVHGDPGRGRELGAGGQIAVAAEARGAGAGDSGDNRGAGRHPADSVVVGVRDEEIAHGVDSDVGRGPQHGVSCRAAVAAEAGDAGAGDRGNARGADRHPADPVALGVRNEEVTRDIHSDTGRVREMGSGGGAAVVAEAGDAGARDGGDEPGAGRDPADPVVVGIRDEEIAHGVDGDAGRGPQLGAGRGTAVTAKARLAGAGDGGDEPGAGRHLPDAAVVDVRDEEVASTVDGDTVRDAKLGTGGQIAVAAETRLARAGDRGDRASRHLADALIVCVRDEEVARGVDGNAGRSIHLGARRGTAVAAETRLARAGGRGDDPRADRDPADAVVVGVRNKEVARGVDGNADRGI